MRDREKDRRGRARLPPYHRSIRLTLQMADRFPLVDHRTDKRAWPAAVLLVRLFPADPRKVFVQSTPSTFPGKILSSNKPDRNSRLPTLSALCRVEEKRRWLSKCKPDHLDHWPRRCTT